MGWVELKNLFFFRVGLGYLVGSWKFWATSMQLRLEIQYLKKEFFYPEASRDIVYSRSNGLKHNSFISRYFIKIEDLRGNLSTFHVVYQEILFFKKKTVPLLNGRYIVCKCFCGCHFFYIKKALFHPKTSIIFVPTNPIK